MDSLEPNSYKRSRRSTIVGDFIAHTKPTVTRSSSRPQEGGELVRSLPCSTSSFNQTSDARRSRSWLGGDMEHLQLASGSASLSSLSSSPMSGKSHTLTLQSKHSSSVFEASHNSDNSVTSQRRYHDISKGTSMANFRLSSRNQRQLRPLRKGVTGMSEADLHALGQRLRLAFHENRFIKNRRWRLVMYAAAFNAIDAIEWLVSQGAADTQQQAITIMLCLQRNGIIYNLLDNGMDFSGAHSYFRFRSDDPGQPSPPVFDLIDVHTANQLRSWASRNTNVIAEHTKDRKSYRLTFIPKSIIEYLKTSKDCNLSEDALVSLCQLLQESGAIVQVYPAQPMVFKASTAMLFRFRQDQVALEAVSDDVRRRGTNKPSFIGSGILPRWIGSTEGISAAVKNPFSRARTILQRSRRDSQLERHGQVYRPEMWNGSNVTLVSSLKDQWGFTLEGTKPVRVAQVDENGPARKLLSPGDVILQIDKLDVFHMTGAEVMSVIRDGKPFFQATIHQYDLASVTMVHATLSCRKSKDKRLSIASLGGEILL